MSQEKEFIKALEEIRKLARSQGNRIEEEQLAAFFAPIGITGQQLEPVYAYLAERGIRLNGEPGEENLDEEEKSYLEEYLESLNRFSVLSEGEKRVLGMAAINGEQEGKEGILKSFLIQVADLARLYAGQGVGLEDLIGEGNVAVASGVELLGCLEDPEEIDGFLGKLAMDAMEAAIRENELTKEADNRIEAQVNRVSEGAAQLYESLRRKVTVKELAEEMELDREEILEALRLCGGSLETIDWREENGE